MFIRSLQNSLNAGDGTNGNQLKNGDGIASNHGWNDSKVPSKINILYLFLSIKYTFF